MVGDRCEPPEDTFVAKKHRKTLALLKQKLLTTKLLLKVQNTDYEIWDGMLTERAISSTFRNDRTLSI